MTRARHFLFFFFILVACQPSTPVTPPPSPGGTGGYPWTNPFAGGSPSTTGGQQATGGTVACRARVTREARTRTAPKARSPRIVGGQPTQPGVWPFAVALQTSTGWQFCGGTLIKPTWVLTAGHCEVSPGERAVLDRVDLRQSGGEVIQFDEVRTHELYVTADRGWDVAVVHLSRPAKTAPIPMAAFGWSAPGDLVEVVGWGLTTEFASGTSPVQRATDVTIMADRVCSAAYPGFPVTALCAGWDQGGKDTCQGDSGGGAFFQTGSGWMAVGITSFGNGCARPGYPGVYTAVAAVREWIEACTVDP